MAVSKKIRFEVFKRDGFRCGYCGKTPPDVVLEVDHIVPVSKGGRDDLQNLLAACFSCNRGKRDIPLDKAPSALLDNLEVLKEKQAQFRAYEKFVREMRDEEQQKIDFVRSRFTEFFPDLSMKDSFVEASLRTFIQRLPFEKVLECLDHSCARFPNAETAIRYFCGMCWKRIKGERW